MNVKAERKSKLNKVNINLQKVLGRVNHEFKERENETNNDVNPSKT